MTLPEPTTHEVVRATQLEITENDDGTYTVKPTKSADTCDAKMFDSDVVTDEVTVDEVEICADSLVSFGKIDGRITVTDRDVLTAVKMGGTHGTKVRIQN